MKHLTLLTLLVFAPLSWGEDAQVFYCVETHNYFFIPPSYNPPSTPSDTRFTVEVDRDKGTISVGPPYNWQQGCVDSSCGSPLDQDVYFFTAGLT